MERQFVSKKHIVLDLSNIEYTAKICKALSSETRLEILRCLIERPMTISQLAETFYLPMSSMCLHIRILKDAGLITVMPKPGVRGMRKFCGVLVSSVILDFFAHRKKRAIQKPPAFVEMPVGYYNACEATPPCGIATVNSYLAEEDSPYSFYDPEHVKASLIWLTSGYLEYHFPNEMLLRDAVDRVEFSFEICSEAPGYNNDWPSDICIELNRRHVVTLHIQGDYGGRRGACNPTWWSNTSTQYGELKHICVTNEGCYLENQKVSDETIESLGILNGFFFSFLFRIDTSSEHVGGMNLFGKHFGDYAQDIVMRVEYSND